MSPSSGSIAPVLPDGLVAVVKRDCPTCEMVAPVLGEIAEKGPPLTVFTQDDPAFPATVSPRFDADLAVSYHHHVETVPTLLRVEGGRELERTEGWSRELWERLSGVSRLGSGLPEHRPGCGSLSVDPEMAELLRVRYEGAVLQARRVELGRLEDEIEAVYDRGWTDGLPVVIPTEARVLRMLDGTTRDASEVVAIVPPDLVPATVEKVAINAVMAGCKPEYLPVVLAAVEAACTDHFNIHGLLCTTYFSGPVLIVNGPITTRIGMNCRNNVLGQGNRANATIGRALQLVVRNVGGGKPGVDGIDRAAFGNPGKYTFCFPENEADLPEGWLPLSVDAGHAPGTNAVTLFGGHGVSAISDQQSRRAEDLIEIFLRHVQLRADPFFARRLDNLVLVIGPEHGRVFSESGWDKARVRAELNERAFAGSTRGVPEPGWDAPAIVFAGGDAGMFSALIEGWVSGPIGSQMTTWEVRP